MKWLKIFDASGSWPTDPAACWADGYRVIAGYAGSQSWKTFTPAMLAKWVTPAHPFGIAAMYESSGDEAFGPDSYNVGAQHARAARAAWRDLGMDDRAAIAYAVDKNATMAQIRGPIARYFQAIKDREPSLPISYLENDGSEYLAIHGITAGGFIPAAYSWGDPPVLATPSNAPPHAIWLQEHNGVALHGGDVDTGHIRDDAPIWWSGGTTMADLTAADVENKVWHTGGSTGVAGLSAGSELHASARDAAAALAQAKANGGSLTEIKAALAAGTPIPSGPAEPTPISDADVQRIALATADLIYARMKA